MRRMPVLEPAVAEPDRVGECQRAVAGDLAGMRLHLLQCRFAVGHHLLVLEKEHAVVAFPHGEHARKAVMVDKEPKLIGVSRPLPRQLRIDLPGCPAGQLVDREIELERFADESLVAVGANQIAAAQRLFGPDRLAVVIDAGNGDRHPVRILLERGHLPSPLDRHAFGGCLLRQRLLDDVLPAVENLGIWAPDFVERHLVQRLAV